MSDTYIPLNDVEFVNKRVIERPDHTYQYVIKMPNFLAKWDVWDYWERERLASMEDRLSTSHTLFDVGTEGGWMSVIFASMVGAQNMCLFEPTPEFWPNIKATWKANQLVNPKSTYCGLVSNHTTNADIQLGDWPVESNTDRLLDATKYRYIHQDSHNTPQLTLDDFVLRTKIVPTAITVDVEGAEIRVLQGAINTLITKHPLVWASLHPDLAAKDYEPVERVHELMAKVGYRKSTHLATDHEQHWFFE